ncbi:MAG: carbohydrate kinase family protein [Dehalococcoidales bacterium]|nr:MAG: carbohydrate kinase family protein [Dehalococcoidales bacterium]
MTDERKLLPYIDCTVIGDAMIDVVLPLSDAQDITSLAEGGVTNTKRKLFSGGAANIAYHVMKLGGNSAFIGRVGDDYFGRLFLDDLERNGIVTNVAIDASANTGMVFALVFPNGQRFFIDDRGANTNLQYNDIDLSLVKRSRFLCFLGYSYQDEGFSGYIEKILDETPDDMTVVFNPGAPNLAEKYRTAFTDGIREHVGVLILNKAEARNLTQCDSESDMIDSLLAIVDTVALTKGEEGSIIATRDEVHEIKTTTVTPLDTTGAGDAYAAGLIYGLSRNQGLREAGEYASRIAGNVVTHFGVRLENLD